MIISLARKKIYIANIKVASTAVESVLRRDADVALTKTEHGKHLSLADVEGRFASLFGPDGIDTFQVFGTIRHPMRWLISIYQSHMAEQFAGTEVYSRGISFDAYMNSQLGRGWDQLIPQLDRFRYGDGQLAAVKWIPLADAASFLEKHWFAGEYKVTLPKRNVSFAGGREPISCSEKSLRSLANIYAHDICIFLANDRGLKDFRLKLNARQEFLRDEIVAFNESLVDKPDEPVTDWQVVQCYRALLRRDPENADVIEDHKRLDTLQGVIEAISSSPEYVRRHLRPTREQ